MSAPKNGEASQICGRCKHWHGKAKPMPPAGMAIVLSMQEEPQRGDCRCMPPGVSVQMVQQGRQVQQISISAYPDLPENFPACGQFRLNNSAIEV